MISGSYSEDEGGRLSAFVYFPSLDHQIRVSFVVDTGATVTSISRRDLLSLGRELAAGLPFRGGPFAMSGVGGRAQWWELDVSLTIPHGDGGVTAFTRPIAVIGTLGLPSLVGRDILSWGILTVDGPQGVFTFDIDQRLIP